MHYCTYVYICCDVYMNEYIHTFTTNIETKCIQIFIHIYVHTGLRMKKWNVTCEPYGRRWRLGDVIGVLVDTDLCEMRFSMNGEDLGSAFQGFSCDIFPAVSLNVRQCVRINFGHYKFLYPPDELDSIPFRPVCESWQVGVGNGGRDGGKEGEREHGSPSRSRTQSHSVGQSYDDTGVLASGGGGALLGEVLADGEGGSDVVDLPAYLASATSTLHVAAQNNYYMHTQLDQRVDDRQSAGREGGREGISDGRDHEEKGDEGDEEEGEEEYDEDEGVRALLETGWTDANDRNRLSLANSISHTLAQSLGRSGDAYAHDSNMHSGGSGGGGGGGASGIHDDAEGEGDGDGDGGRDGGRERGREGGGDDDDMELDDSPHIIELRRQALIENLIGMGFPVRV